MSDNELDKDKAKELMERFIDRSKEEVADCYQCGKCSAGCPNVDNMSVLPHRIIRMLQHGQIEKALHEESIWKCVSCEVCTSRCPRCVSLSKIKEALRFLYMDIYGSKYKQSDVSEQVRTDAPQQAIISADRKNHH